MKYYLFGLQRSGTNFMEQIIKRNFNGQRVNRSTQSWKHSIDIPQKYDRKELTVIMYKNPYTWVESICFRNNVDWIKTQKTYPVKNGPAELGCGPNHFNIKQLALTYKHWSETWLNLENNKSIIVQYEGLLEHEKRDIILNDMAIKFNSRKKNTWSIPDRGKVSQSKDYNNEREKYYLNMKPEKLSESHIEAITETIGTEIIRTMGYEPL